MLRRGWCQSFFLHIWELHHKLREAPTCQNGWYSTNFQKRGKGSFSIQKRSLKKIAKNSTIKKSASRKRADSENRFLTPSLIKLKFTNGKPMKCLLELSKVIFDFLFTVLLFLIFRSKISFSGSCFVTARRPLIMASDILLIIFSSNNYFRKICSGSALSIPECMLSWLTLGAKSSLSPGGNPA